MDFLARCLAFMSLILLFSSCSTIQYYTEILSGQLALQNRAVENKKVLKDPRVSRKNKEKIKTVEIYKEYFYEYFERQPTKIYSQTTMLDGPAVMYLVISSKFDVIRPKKECHLLIGCFPYIGFYKKESAEKYQKKLEKKDYFTYRRPVYAYSTLGFFQDAILSSFFYYDDYHLAEMIFHEIFHTIFFVKNEVDLNENLANFFGKKMAQEYFKKSTTEKEEKARQEMLFQDISLKIVKLTSLYKKNLEENKPKTKQQAKLALENFLQETFLPELKDKCQELGIKDCRWAKREWNNASFAAFLTYEKKMDKIAKLYNNKAKNLKDFLAYIEKRYQNYRKKDIKGTFETYLLGD